MVNQISMLSICIGASFLVGCSSSGFFPENVAGAENPVEAARLAAETANLPATKIIIAPLDLSNSKMRVGEWVIREDNPGYENQPWFVPGQASFYYVAQGESGKTDIWRADLDEGLERQQNVTVRNNEFSPRLSPDGQYLTYVQELEAGAMTRVHRLSLSDTANDNAASLGDAVFDFGPIGYYAFLDGGAKAIAYARTEPGSLMLIEVESGDALKLADNVGRGLLADPNGARAFFTSVTQTGAHLLQSYDWRTGEIDSYFELVDGAQDFALLFHDDGSLKSVLSASNRQLRQRDLEDNAWTIFADYSDSDIGEISRVAVSDDEKWLAFVVADNSVASDLLEENLDGAPVHLTHNLRSVITSRFCRLQISCRRFRQWPLHR